MNHHPRHQCLIYAGAPSRQLPIIGGLIIDNLKAGYRCFYLNSPAMVSGLRSYLAAEGVDLKEQIERGALMLSSDQSHLIEGRFEIEPMLSMLKSAAHRSVTDGFKGLWASGDMTWEFGNEHNLEKLLEYECKLEHLFHEIPTLHGICQYHMETLPSYSIQEALYTHPRILINETLSKVNPYYAFPTHLSMKRPNTSLSELKEMLLSLCLPPYPTKAAVALD